MFGNKLFGFFNGLFHGAAVQCKAVKRLLTGSRRIHYRAFLGIKTLFRHIGTFDKRNNRQVKVAGKSIVTTVVCGHSHDGSRAIACQNILTYPYGYIVTGERINRIRAAKYACNLAIAHAIKLCSALNIV